jgi:hypothetical protein
MKGTWGVVFDGPVDSSSAHPAAKSTSAKTNNSDDKERMGIFPFC